MSQEQKMIWNKMLEAASEMGDDRYSELIGWLRNNAGDPIVVEMSVFNESFEGILGSVVFFPMEKSKILQRPMGFVQI